MEYKKGYTISDVYQGGYSSFREPGVYNSNNYISAGSLGMTTDPRTANILQEVSTKLNAGVKNIEVEAVSPEVFDSIPKQQLREVHRLSKLTGIDVSMHAPVMDVSGIDPRSGFSEGEREISERKVTEALLRAHELNPEGNINVNFHSAEGIPGSQLLPPSQRGEKGAYKRLIAINRETGRLAPLERETEYHPGGEVREVVNIPEHRIEALNDTEWKNSLFQIEVNRENAERIMTDIDPIVIARFTALQSGKVRPEEILTGEQMEFNKLRSAWEFVEQAKLAADSQFSKAYEFAKKDDDEDKMKLLQNLSKRYGEIVGREGDKINPEKYFNPKLHADALQELTLVLEHSGPQAWVPLEKFAIQKSSESFGNAAWQAYKKLDGKNVPILAIENPPAGFALSTGKDVRDVVDASRKQFIKKAVEEGSMSEGEAREQAEKMIGATWDVGHINMLRKFGYSQQEIVKEAEAIAPVLKHVHLSDNFGFEHTELPMGMGNVPFKEIMQKLGQKGYDAKKIVEAAGWWQHFRSSPFQESLEAMGSPIYSMKMAPYWNQATGLYQGYFGGYGQMLPQINYETFGAGFSRLPAELGGQAPGGQGGRMSGRPME